MEKVFKKVKVLATVLVIFSLSGVVVSIGVETANSTAEVETGWDNVIPASNKVEAGGDWEYVKEAK